MVESSKRVMGDHDSGVYEEPDGDGQECVQNGDDSGDINEE